MLLTTPTVVVCEPQWAGLMHASFNAALLETVRAALPGWRVVFAADSSHFAAIRDALVREGRGVDDLEFLDSPVRHTRTWGRRAQSAPIWRLGEIVRSQRPRVVILASVTAFQIAVAKLALGVLAAGSRVVAFLHENAIGVLIDEGLVGGLVVGRLRDRWNRGAWPLGWTFGVFGERVLREVRRYRPDGGGASIVAIRPPYLLEAAPTEEEITRRWRARRIVLVGNTYKGRLDEFLRAVRAVQKASPDARFVLAGELSGADSSLVAEARRLFGDEAGPGMLPWETYRKRLHDATFGVVHLDPENYRARISAGTLDTLSACLPSAIRSMPFNDSCVEDDALPAALYRDTKDLEAALRSFLENTSFDRYRETVAAIEYGRRVFSPYAVGNEIRTVVRDVLGVEVEV